MWTPFGRLMRYEIMSIISVACDFTTKSGGICNFFVAQDSTAMEMPRAWTATALERRISLALLTGSLLKAIAAVCAPQAMGPWDRQPVRSAGRLANYLAIHAWHFSALALRGVEPRNYRKDLKELQGKELQRQKVA
jgi:hypothetical protein